MTSRRHEGDLLVLGYSLEAALAAALVAKAGGKVLWLGSAPESTTLLAKQRLPAAPSLVPSLSQAPVLARVLREVGLLVDAQRNLVPVSVQFLGDRRRISSAEDWLKVPQGQAGLDALQESASVAGQVSGLPLGLGFFARRRFINQRKAVDARLSAPAGIVGEATSLLDGLFARDESNLRATLQTLAAPTDLPGGTLTLGQMLQRKCVDLGARLFPEGLQKPLVEFRVGWKGLEGRLFSGEALAARVALIAIDENTSAEVMPPASPLTKRLKVASGQPLLRLSFVIKRRGLPEPLGTMALIVDEQPLWLERRALSAELSGVSLFWRPWLSDRAAEAELVRAALGRVAPFYQSHLVDQSAPTTVPDHDRGSVFAKPFLGRRLIAARGPLWTLGGAEGAALAATALAERCLRLAPPPKTGT
jgi:hypothetical protein